MLKFKILPDLEKVAGDIYEEIRKRRLEKGAARASTGQKKRVRLRERDPWI